MFVFTIICNQNQYYERICTEALKRKTEIYFEGRSARSQHFFALDIEWLETNLNTRETEFYNYIFQRNIEGQAESDISMFSVPVVNSK